MNRILKYVLIAILVIVSMVLLLVGLFFLVVTGALSGSNPEGVFERSNEMIDVSTDDESWNTMYMLYQCAGIEHQKTYSKVSGKMTAIDEETGKQLVLVTSVDRELSLEKSVTCTDENGNPIHTVHGEYVTSYIQDNDCVPRQPETELIIDHNTWMTCRGSIVHILMDIPPLTHEEEDAQIMVARAMDLYKKDPEAAFAAIEDPTNEMFHDGNLYVFVLDEHQTIISHGTMPDLIGQSLHDIVDVNGTNIGELFLNATAKLKSGETGRIGIWVEYYWPHPSPDIDGEHFKKTWVRDYKGPVIFGAGVYHLDGDAP